MSPLPGWKTDPGGNVINPLLDLAARPVIGHRGASGEAPENTLPAFELALAQGAHALELDVRVSADGVPLVLHDPALDRTTDRSGLLAAIPAAAAREADAGARFSPDGGATYPWRGRGVRIPTLAEVLERFPEAPLLIEVKEPAVQNAVRAALLQHQATARCVVASEDAAALEVFRSGPFLVGASGEDIKRLYFGTLFGVAPGTVPYRLLSVPVRHRGLPVPTRRFVRAAHRLGCPVHVWTVNQAGLARRLWQRGVCGIITNFPGAIAREATALG
jgi:glycerophosphoryl diester phosphodiesterase